MEEDSMAAIDKDKQANPFFPWVAPKRCSPDDFINSWQKIVPSGKQKFSPQKLLGLKPKNDISNLDKIWGTYDSLEKKKYQNDYSNGNLPYIKAGTSLWVPKDDTPLILAKASKQGQFVSQNDFPAYWSEAYKKIISDETYVPDKAVTIKRDDTGINAKFFSVNVRVWMYIKALDKVIDVSPYVVQLSTLKSMATGEFSLMLSPFYYNGSTLKTGDSHLELFNTVANNGVQVKNFLEKKVQFNDLVFIRYERLLIEGKESRTVSGTVDLEVPLTNLAGNNVWDMIGFVDANTLSYSAESRSMVTSITGRDMSKLFEDDGSYFIPLLNLTGVFEHWYDTGSSQEAFFKRNIIDGQYNYIWSYSFKPIRECVWFIVNIMANLGVVGSKVFDSWKDKRTTSYQIEDTTPQEVNGVWQILKVFIDSNIDKRILVDSNLGNPNGTLMEYMKRTCQAPFVEFFFDTYQSNIDLIIRQPPFNEKAILGAYRAKQYITVTADNVFDYSLEYDSRIYSWYQLKVMNNNTGGQETTSLAFVPIVYLNEYVELFGNKKLEVVDPYLFYEETEGIEKTEKLCTFQAAALNDLIYLLETTVYLPFTRTGTITMNGDRRIKVGTFILFESTNEFFYVTNVMNDVAFGEDSISRRTTVRVERGMFVPILDQNFATNPNRKDNAGTIETGGTTPSYFKIVDVTPLKKAAQEAQSGKIATLTSPQVNKKQFDFFLNRKMYAGR